MEYEKAEAILSELLDELPEEFFHDLNAGVVLSRKSKKQTKSLHPHLYILGEYSRNNLGKQITLYHGSLNRAFGQYSDEAYTEEMRKVLRHEFRHHVEFLAGVNDLEIEDQVNLSAYDQEAITKGLVENPHKT